MRVHDVSPGPLSPDDGPAGARRWRRVRGITIELVSFVVLTVLLPLALVVALVVDAVLWVARRKRPMAVRLVALAWCFLLNEMHALVALTVIDTVCLRRDTLRRRRLLYESKLRWVHWHWTSVRLLFSLRFEIEGLEEAGPGPVVVLIRHASIIDNLLGDAVLGRAHGLALRYVLKRELQMLPIIDIGGRWVPTCFVRRASGNSAAEIETLRGLARDLGSGEGVLIYPEGTRYTPAKLARAQEIVAERQPHLSPLANRLHHLLPPRLGGPVALLQEARGVDVVLFGHVGLDGFEYIRDIWAGGLVGTTVRMKLWRFPADEIPTDDDELGRWVYDRWQTLDDWVGVQLGQAAALSSASAASERT